jgi:hypothetical protein
VSFIPRDGYVYIILRIIYNMNGDPVNWVVFDNYEVEVKGEGVGLNTIPSADQYK